MKSDPSGQCPSPSDSRRRSVRSTGDAAAGAPTSYPARAGNTQVVVRSATCALENERAKRRQDRDDPTDEGRVDHPNQMNQCGTQSHLPLAGCRCTSLVQRRSRRGLRRATHAATSASTTRQAICPSFTPPAPIGPAPGRGRYETQRTPAGSPCRRDPATPACGLRPAAPHQSAHR